MAPALPRRLAFEDFDAPKRPVKTAGPPPPDPAALAKAKAEGLAEGRRAALEELAAETARAEAARADAEARTLEAATTAFEGLNASAEDGRRRAEIAASRLVAAILQRITPGLSDQHAVDRAAAFLDEIRIAAADSAKVIVRAGTAAAPAAEAVKANIRAKSVEVYVDTGLAPHAIEADWDRGAAAWDAGAVTEELTHALSRAADALAGAATNLETPAEETAP